MMKNEPAFPHPSGAQGCDGLSKRDWFAGMALAGLAAALGKAERRNGETQAQADALWSYERADAMLAAKGDV